MAKNRAQASGYLVTRLRLVTHCVAGSACTKMLNYTNIRRSAVGKRGGAS